MQLGWRDGSVLEVLLMPNSQVWFPEPNAKQFTPPIIRSSKYPQRQTYAHNLKQQWSHRNSLACYVGQKATETEVKVLA